MTSGAKRPDSTISKERPIMQRTIIFLHGKQSTPEGSGSGKAIREHFSKEYNVLIPDYKPMERTHGEIEAYLKEYISPHPGALIVGISLGGYCAYRMNCTPLVILNTPCFKWIDLFMTKAIHSGHVRNNFIEKLHTSKF